MISTVFSLLVPATLLSSVGGRPEIDGLLVKIPPKVGDSDRICSALVRDEYFWHFFPVFNAFETDINRSSARKTLANMHRTITELDRKFTEELRGTVHFMLRMYNALARDYLTVGSAMGKMKIDREAFSVFGFLDVSDVRVKTDFDNAILYAYAEHGKRSLIERVSGYEYDELLNIKSNADTISRLAVLNNDLQRLSNAFGHRYRLGWFDVYEFGRAPGRRIGFRNLGLTDYYGRLMNEMKCKIWIPEYDNLGEVIEKWDCTQKLTLDAFGFLAHKTVRSGVDSSRKTARRKDPSSSDPERGTMVTMSLSEISDWMLKNMNAVNILIYNNVFAELIMYTVASISAPLYTGAEHFLYVYCVGLVPYLTKKGVRYLRYLRTSLLQFNRLYGKIVDVIRERLHVDVTGMDRFKPMARNLSTVVDIASLSDHDGNTAAEKMLSMRKAVEAEYGRLFPSVSNWFYIRDKMIAKRTFLMSPIIRLRGILYLFRLNS